MQSKPTDKAYDLFSPIFKADPFETFAQMRQDDPIYAHQAPNGTINWYITRYDDVVAVLKDNVHFCKDVQNASDNIKKPKRGTIHQSINKNMLFSDPPDHTRLRALVTQAFTPRRIEQVRVRVQEIADELLDSVMAAGEMDLIAEYALPLPVVVICDMLGIPKPDQQMVSEWSQSIISPGSRGLNYKERRRQMKAFVNYLRGLFVQRQQQPQDDLITALVEAEESGDRLTEPELSSMVALLLVTGHETTVNLIGNGVLALLQHPAQLALLQENGGMWETAVEELLRYDGPVETSTTRWVKKDVHFRGHHMQRGDIMRVVITSANRDAAQFESPDRLDVAAGDKRHLSFGVGIHYCLGAPLARLEGQIALATLFQRFPTIQLAVAASDLQWRSGVLFRGLETLPLKFPSSL
ncbi:MAG: cytochrome P450 [Chloroflexi bacterium]|nr:cytochrome P450 [Chloroflexota bacterium]